MNAIASLNLIHFLDFYFAVMFFAGLVRRWGLYRSVAGLVMSGQRWPHLLKLISQYRTIFWNFKTVLPALVALAVWMIQMIASRYLFPEAGKPPDGLTMEILLTDWPAALVVIPVGTAMFAFDIYTLYVVGQFDRAELEKYLDQAEYWLRSRTAHVVRVVTFGYINPRRMVAVEVEKALSDVNDMLNFNLWWIILQTALRLGFALSLWITWALAH
jgi:hypothetical protein